MHRMPYLATTVVAALLAFPAVAGAQASPGNILIGAAFDHAANDDPIVYPGQPGASHEHAFCAAKNVNADTTFQSLVDGETTATLPGDTAAYWMPTIVNQFTGEHVNPLSCGIYYRRAGAVKVLPFPMALKHVQGDRLNTNPNRAAMVYSCGTGQNTVYIPATCTQNIVATITFPRCWNGRELDNAAHRTLGPCGPDFPVVVPQITLSFTFPSRAAGGRLTSDKPGAGAGLSGHADFFNGWQPHAMDLICELCLNTPDKHCRVDRQARRVVDVGVHPNQPIFSF